MLCLLYTFVSDFDLYTLLLYASKLNPLSAALIWVISGSVIVMDLTRSIYFWIGFLALHCNAFCCVQLIINVLLYVEKATAFVPRKAIIVIDGDENELGVELIINEWFDAMRVFLEFDCPVSRNALWLDTCYIAQVLFIGFLFLGFCIFGWA